MGQDATPFRQRPPAIGARQSVGTIARGAVYHARTAALVFLATVFAGVVIALLMPARYVSEARLLALPADYSAVSGRDKTGTSAAEAFKPEQLAAVEMQLLSSEDLQREVLRREGVGTNDPAALEKARKSFAKALSIERVDGANVIELAYKATDPQEARARLQALLDVYFQTRAQVLTSGQSALIARQRDAAAHDLSIADTALRTYQEAHGIADIDGQVSGAIAVDTALRQDLASTRADLSQTQGDASRLRGASVPQTVELYRDDTEATKAVADMQAQILALQAKRADLSGRYMAGSPLIEQVDKQIAGLRTAIETQSGQLREAHRVGRNSYYDAARDRIIQTDAAASGQSAKLGKLGTELSASETRLRTLNEVAGTVTSLRTHRDIAEARYKNLSTQYDEAHARELEAGTGTTNVRVIQRPSVPEANGNAPLMVIAGSVVAGLVLAAGVLFMLVAVRETFLDRREIKETLGLPVLVDLTGNRAQAARLPVQVPSAQGPRGRVIALVTAEPHGYDAELATLLRQFGNRDGAPLEAHVGTVTFEESAYGLGHGELARLLPDPAGHGHVKVGSAAWAIDRTGERLLDTMRDSLLWTILLIPPIPTTSVEDACEARGLEAAALADEVLLVVRTEVTRKSAAETILAALRELNAPVSGVMLLGRRLQWPRFIRSLN